MLDRLKTICTELTQKWECELLEFNGESDHVHLLLSLNPKVAPSVFANNLKTVSSRYIRKDIWAGTKKVLLEQTSILESELLHPDLWRRALVHHQAIY